jgi:phospholipase C
MHFNPVEARRVDTGRVIMRLGQLGLFLFSMALLAGCGARSAPSLIGAGGPISRSPQASHGPGAIAGNIQHVVIIVQENRTVDNLFNGFPGADTVKFGFDHNGRRIKLHQVNLEDPHDPCHSHTCWKKTYDNGNLDGFDLNNPPGTNPDYDYAYVNPSEAQPYFTMAQTYAFADEMFQSNSGPSYPAHEYLIAGQSAMVDENPNGQKFDGWGCDSPSGTYTLVLGSDGSDHRGPFPCFSYLTLADEMDHAHVTWRYYAPAIGSGTGGIWSGFDAVSQIRFSRDWTNDVISPETNFFSDLASGNFAQVTWIIPSKVNSDHAADHSSTGPAWVTSIVNAIGSSPYWSSTAIFITWDDWGGWFDHISPPQLDAMGLGYRVPLIVVSPFAQQGYVSHVQHEFGSVMKFTEEAFNLPSLGLIDSRADDLIDCFNFGQARIHFVPIRTGAPPNFYLRQKRSTEPPDNE